MRHRQPLSDTAFREPWETSMKRRSSQHQSLAKRASRLGRFLELRMSRLTGGVWARRSKTFIVRQRAPKGPNRSAPLVSATSVVAGARFELWKRPLTFEFLLTYWPTSLRAAHSPLGVPSTGSNLHNSNPRFCYSSIGRSNAEANSLALFDVPATHERSSQRSRPARSALRKRTHPSGDVWMTRSAWASPRCRDHRAPSKRRV